MVKAYITNDHTVLGSYDAIIDTVAGYIIGRDKNGTIISSKKSGDDDSEVFNDIINYVGSGSRIVLLNNGKVLVATPAYTIKNPIIVNKDNISIIGMSGKAGGFYSGPKIKTVGNIDTIRVTARNFKCEGITFSTGYNAIHLNKSGGSVGFIVKDCAFVDILNYGIYMETNGGDIIGPIRIQDNVFASSTLCEAHVKIVGTNANVTDIVISDNIFEPLSKYQVYLYVTGSGKQMEINRISGNYFESGEGNISCLQIISNDSAIIHFHGAIRDDFFYGIGEIGKALVLQTTNTGQIWTPVIDTCEFANIPLEINAAAAAASIRMPRIINSYFASSTAKISNVGSGSAVKYLHISNNEIHGDITIGGIPYFEINENVISLATILLGAGYTYSLGIIENNNSSTGTAAVISGTPNAASKLKYRNNSFYVTDNLGNTVIPSGATYVDVTHGLAITPLAENIRITPTNNLGNATKYWISDIGTTTFRINVNTDPGVTTATFAWKHNVN